MNREAHYSIRQKLLGYWRSPNACLYVNCPNLKEAKRIVRDSGIEQKLMEIEYIELHGAFAANKGLD